MSSAGRADRSPEIQRLLEEALNNQTASWGRGERTLVEDYLVRQPALRGDDEAVLDLIYHEFLLRRKLEEGLDPHDYCTRFPELAESLMLQFGLDAAITLGCESPGASAPRLVPSIARWSASAITRFSSCWAAAAWRSSTRRTT